MKVASFACSLLCVLFLSLVHGQTAAESKPVVADEVFKNVQVLKGITVNQFMGTMGIFSAALGMSCEDCHTSSDTGWDAYAAAIGTFLVVIMLICSTAIFMTTRGGRFSYGD